MLGEKGWSGDKVSRGRDGGKVVQPPEAGQSGDEGRVMDSMVVTWRTEREGHKENRSERLRGNNVQRGRTAEGTRETNQMKGRCGSEGVQIWTQMSAELFLIHD